MPAVLGCVAENDLGVAGDLQAPTRVPLVAHGQMANLDIVPRRHPYSLPHGDVVRRALVLHHVRVEEHLAVRGWCRDRRPDVPAFEVTQVDLEPEVVEGSIGAP